MNIGIDIDGVLTNLENYISTVGKRYMLQNNLKLLITPYTISPYST